MASARGICPVCFKDFALTMDGRIRGHGWRWYREAWCMGSWELPYQGSTAPAAGYNNGMSEQNQPETPDQTPAPDQDVDVNVDVEGGLANEPPDAPPEELTPTQRGEGEPE